MKKLIPYIFLLPYFLLLLFFAIIPIIFAIIVSFTDAYVGGFAGIYNYILVLEDYRILDATKNVALYIFIWIPMMALCIIMLSIMLQSVTESSSRILRLSYYLPGAFTTSALALLWLFLLDPNVSPFSFIWNLFEWKSKFDVMNGLSYAGTFALMAFFANIGGWIIVTHGSLTSISSEIIEASTIDGCSPFRLALHIKIPMIFRTIALMVILSLAGGIQLFVEPQLINLASTTNSSADWSLNQIAYEYAFVVGDFGVSIALSMLMLLFSLFLAILIIWKTNFYRIN
tara:strand:+ start:609 stop:1466 length:858 start_codon:yes stop_codon:yes gene_type:complete